MIVFLNLLPWLVLILDFMQFMITAMIWTLFWFSIAAFFNSRLLEKPFQPFMNEEEEISE